MLITIYFFVVSMKDRLKEMQERAKHYKEGETFEMAPLNDQNSGE